MLDRCALVLSAVFLVQLAACRSDKVGVTFDPLTLFPTQASYAWDDPSNVLPEKLRASELDFDAVLKEVADEEFAARGYHPIASGSPDYRLSYQVSVSTWFGPNNTRSIGSLSLLLVQSETNHRVWMGFAQAEVHVGLTRKERKERLRKALVRMLDKFPPAQRGD